MPPGSRCHGRWQLPADKLQADRAPFPHGERGVVTGGGVVGYSAASGAEQQVGEQHDGGYHAELRDLVA